MALNPKFSDWRDVRVWVVGASTGIGAAAAKLLLARGARVAVSARSADKLTGLIAGHAHALALPLDVTDAGAQRAAHAQIAQAWGGLDLAILCAGTYSPLRADQFDLAVINHHFAVNFTGVLHGIDAVLPGMLAAAQGHIAVVASVAGYRGLPNALAYGPSKAALINLAETLYLDLHEKGLGVSVINPGFVETPLTAQNTFAMPALMSAEEAAREIVKGLERGEFETHFPKRFTRTLKALGLLPDAAYFKAIKKGTGL